eukprot:3199296-Pyramimonas_sp.AAC.1
MASHQDAAGLIGVDPTAAETRQELEDLAGCASDDILASGPDLATMNSTPPGASGSPRLRLT